jgi:DtxR family Mn-dependent transcriptional regulator
MTEAGFEGPVPITTLAEALSIQPVSVNQMARKMEEAGLLVYQPYKGIALTPEGGRIATRTLRYRRLWEVFLFQHLRMPLEEATAKACDFEHDTSENLANRLDAFLGFPSISPHGKPIPQVDSSVLEPPLVALATLTLGQCATVIRFDLSETARSFLNDQGIYPGVALTIAAATNESLLVHVGENFVALARSLAEAVQVEQEANKNFENGPVRCEPEKGKVAMEFTAELKNKIPLDKMKVGQLGAVVHVGGKGPARRRMVDMGLVPGAEVKVVRMAPLGDPVEFEVMGYSLSLRKSEAREITVELLPEARP